MSAHNTHCETDIDGCTSSDGSHALIHLCHYITCFSLRSEVRKRFSKLLKLDGTDLPPLISFDVESSAQLPPSKQTFLCHPEGQTIVRQFLQQYYELMDSNNRQPLLQAYHENATFSLTSAYPFGQNVKNSSWLSWYMTDSRNLQRVTDPLRRLKLLRHGHVSIITFLQDMPITVHDIHSFTVDLTLFTPQMMLLTIQGLFKELKSGYKIPPIRCFYRTLVVVPFGTGFCIANEMLHISNATSEQAKLAFKGPVQPRPHVVHTSPAIQQATTSPAVVAVAAALPQQPLDAQTKQQMVQLMSTESGMNLEWSQKCLEENNWNYELAGTNFQEAQRHGIIPPDAFVK